MKNDWIVNTGKQPVEDYVRIDVAFNKDFKDLAIDVCANIWDWKLTSGISHWRFSESKFLEDAYDTPESLPFWNGSDTTEELKFPETTYEPLPSDNKRPFNARVAEAYNTMFGGNLEDTDISAILSIILLMEQKGEIQNT